MKRPVIALLFTIVAASAHAQGITAGEITVGGTGCQSPATATLGGTVLSPVITFDGYRPTVGGRDGTVLSRGSCNLAIPLDVPDGMSVAVVGTGYRLDTAILPGTTAIVSVEAFFAGDQGPVLTRTVSGPSNGKFVGAAVITSAGRQWSACGADLILRANTSIRLTAEAAAPAASTLTMEQLRIRLAVRAC